jgi:DNA (cytosine-5)-methyltransferase 1
VGYHEGGFDVEGCDVRPQPRYPFAFELGDARDVIWRRRADFDAFHVSPPCQRYTTGGRVRDRESRPDLIGPLREVLEAIGKPYVIENVVEAPLRADVVLCGSMFGLAVRRHRVFETNVALPLLTLSCDHSRPIAGVYGHPHGRAGAWPGMLPSTVETWSAAMGIDWMDAHGLAEAIPPAYTRWLAPHLLAALERAA